MNLQKSINKLKFESYSLGESGYLPLEDFKKRHEDLLHTLYNDPLGISASTISINLEVYVENFGEITIRTLTLNLREYPEIIITTDESIVSNSQKHIYLEFTADEYAKEWLITSENLTKIENSLLNIRT